MTLKLGTTTAGNLRIGSTGAMEARLGTTRVWEMPEALFASNEQGLWLDPSDTSTMFQNASGTTPVTGVEQAVGLVLDKSKGLTFSNGPQAYNLLRQSEQLGLSPWTAGNTTVGAGITFNNINIQKLTNTATIATALVTQTQTVTTSTTYELTTYASYGDAPFVVLFTTDGVANGLRKSFNVQTGTVGATQTIGSGWTLVAADMTLVGIGVYRLRMRVTNASSTRLDSGAHGAVDTNNTTNSTSGRFNFVGGFDLRLASQANLTPTYQPITSSWAATMPGNHVSQSADARRPILRARYNEVERTEEFENAYWTKTDVSATADQGVAPNGTTTADRITVSATNASHFVTRVLGGTSIVGANYTASVYAKKENHNFIQLFLGGSAFGLNAWANFDLDAGVLGTVGASATANITNIGNGWYRCVVSANATAAVAGAFSCGVVPSATATRNVTWSGAGTESVLLWGADYRLSNTNVGLPVYQRVVTSTNYDTTGFPPYLAFDGTDDCLFTASTVDFTATDKMTGCIGAQKLSDAAFNAIVESSANPDTTAGSFSFSASISRGVARQTWSTAVYGTTSLAGGALTFAAPDTRVATSLADIAQVTAATEAVLRLNGVQQTLDFGATTSAGTGNFGNHTVFVGARNNASLRFNGRIYGLIVRGATTATPTLEQTETWMNGKTAAF
jgi:hypothetical protein